MMLITHEKSSFRHTQIFAMAAKHIRLADQPVGAFASFFIGQSLRHHTQSVASSVLRNSKAICAGSVPCGTFLSMASDELEGPLTLLTF